MQKGTSKFPRHGELHEALLQPTYTIGRTTRRASDKLHTVVLGEQTLEGFEAIKDELTKTSMLAYFDPKADHYIQVEGSMKGLSVVLL